MTRRGTWALLLWLAGALGACSPPARPEPRPAPSLPPAFTDAHWRRAAQDFAKAYHKWAAVHGPQPVRIDRILNVTDSHFDQAKVETSFRDELVMAGIEVTPREDPAGMRLQVEATDERQGDRSRKTMIYSKLLDPRGGVLVYRAYMERTERLP